VSKRLEHVVTGVLVVCAILITTAVVKREFISASPIADGRGFPKPRAIADGAALATSGNVLGPTDAAVKIVEFSDFECPFCKDAAVTLATLQARYPHRIAVIYRHLPLRIHPNSRAAALAAECAAAQHRFEQYYTVLFAHQDSIGIRSWGRFALDAGVRDTAALNACIGGEWARARIAEDIASASRLQLTGTPTLIIGNQAVSAALPIDSMESWIRRVVPRGLTF
jgi:protein-disulfide isomerase